MPDHPLRSFISVASDHPFPIQNLPYCAFRLPGEEHPRIAVRIGDELLDLKVLEHAGFFRDTPLGDAHVFCKRSLNKFMARGIETWTAVRARITELLREDNPTLRDDADLRGRALVPIEAAELCMPVEIGDYTDFYSSKQHAFNVGTMFRGPENALMPNYTWIPVGYHGRASSIVLSGTPIRRPCGQTRADDADAPTFGPSRLLDFELEMGFFTGPGNTLGTPIPLQDTPRHLFGLTLVNDWSARDVQKWEYQPLGPFLAKNFATTISPYIVPLEALAPFACRPSEPDHRPLDYLCWQGGRDEAMRQLTGGRDCLSLGGWTYDITLEVALQAADMPTAQTISRSNFRHLYWTMMQQLAHHSVTGCNIRPGDLLASGTISAPEEDGYGSMLELAWRGTKPIRLSNGSERKFIQDGDTVILRGWAQGEGYRIGFGDCAGSILPAL